MLLVGIGVIGNNHVCRVHNQAFDRTANSVGPDGGAFRAAGQLKRYPAFDICYFIQTQPMTKTVTTTAQLRNPIGNPSAF